MRNINIHIFLLLTCVSTVAEDSKVPTISSNIPAKDSLFWDLQSLSNVPEAEWIVDTGRVHAVLFRSVDFERHPTRAFAYFSDPDILMKRKSTFTATIPDDGFRIGCIVVRDNRGFMTSSGFILN